MSSVPGDEVYDVHSNTLNKQLQIPTWSDAQYVSELGIRLATSLYRIIRKLKGHQPIKHRHEFHIAPSTAPVVYGHTTI